MATAGSGRWLSWALIALGAVLLLAAANYLFVAGRLGLFAVLEICAGLAFIAAGIAQRFSSERRRVALVLRIVAGVLYLGSAAFYLAMPGGRKPGEKCAGGLGSCTTNSTATQCQDGIIAEIPCRGPKGCFKSGALAMTCDVSVAREREPCMNENEGKFACSEDLRAGLVCQQHRFERSRECTGARGCFVTNGQIACDITEQQ
jgi:hypothetical protein